jgi:hypothetical protein
MRTFTLEQVKLHFIGVPYSTTHMFMLLLIQNHILVKMAYNAYAYDFDKLDQDMIDLIVEECQQKQKQLNNKRRNVKRNYIKESL